VPGIDLLLVGVVLLVAVRARGLSPRRRRCGDRAPARHV